MADPDATDDITAGFFQFQPRTLGSLFSSGASSRNQKLSAHGIGYTNLHKLNGFSENSYSFPSGNFNSKEMSSLEDACSVADAAEALSQPERSLCYSLDPNKYAVGVGKQHQDDASGQFQKSSMDSTDHLMEAKKVDDMEKTIDPQEKCLRQETCDISSQCNSRSSPEVPISTETPKILLVEDNKINIMVSQSMMKQLGHSIHVVNNGVEAVRAVQCHGYDLILMDVCMPVMDGLQATRLIRSFEETGNWDAATEAGIEQPASSSSLPNGQDSLPSTKRVPIIAMTANALSESAEECFANGMDSFVSKPVNFQKLKQCLGKYLP